MESRDLVAAGARAWIWHGFPGLGSVRTTHWLRPFNAPEEGTSFSNVQIEALLGYQFTNGISVAVGGRHWRIDSSFGQSTIEGLPQTISLNSQRWGGFLQASYKFGELRPTRYN